MDGLMVIGAGAWIDDEEVRQRRDSEVTPGECDGHVPWRWQLVCTLSRYLEVVVSL